MEKMTIAVPPATDVAARPILAVNNIEEVTKLKGAVKLVAPGSLPNDGKALADERPSA